jgi:hypothetical protein
MMIVVLELTIIKIKLIFFSSVPVENFSFQIDIAFLRNFFTRNGFGKYCPTLANHPKIVDQTIFMQ